MTYSLEQLKDRKKYMHGRMMEIARKRLNRVIKKLWNNPFDGQYTYDEFVMKAAVEFGLEIGGAYSPNRACWRITIPGEVQ
jgi:hypothetical protein